VANELSDSDSDHVRDATDLRGQVARSLQGRVEPIVQHAVALFPFAGIDVAADERASLTERTVQLFIAAIRDHTLEADDVLLAELAQFAARTGLGVRALFTVVYLVERAAIDALALDDSFGISSAPWPTLEHAVRRAAFDLCGTLAERMGAAAAAGGVVDPLTTLHTRAVFVTAVEKEIQRSVRFGEPFALILIDVDHLTDINRRYGYGTGDLVLERVGIVVRKYFRDVDWVARLGDDAFAVLLPAIHSHDAERLAERVRITVQDRLQVHDYRSDEQVPVTISVGVLVADSGPQTENADGLVVAVQEATDRAKAAGGNRVERALLTAPGADA
jgi:diguanylate cyclase (GGDEF)-like protein